MGMNNSSSYRTQAFTVVRCYCGSLDMKMEAVSITETP
jgi:hypothetical protein